MCVFSGLLNCSYFFHLEKRLDVSWSLTVTIMFGDIMMWGSFTVKKVMCVVYFIVTHFQMCFCAFTEKGQKTAEKKFSTSFWVHAAPISWSKYTTYVMISHLLLVWPAFLSRYLSTFILPSNIQFIVAVSCVLSLSL